MTTASIISAVAVSSPSIAASVLDESQAALARAEYMIETLRTCYVREGFHDAFLDDAKAERVLHYFRQFAAGRDDESEYKAVIDFCAEYGQSLDWLFRGDVRGLIAGGAHRSCGASGSDPAFNAIEEHRKLRAALPVTKEEENHDATFRRLVKAERRLARTEPQTVAGTVAMLAYVNGLADNGDDILQALKRTGGNETIRGDFMRNIERGLRRLV